MTLGQKQRLFSRHVALLILKAYELGYEVSLGEAWRTPEQARANAAKGTGISNSLHMERLAVDLNLFKDGVFLTKTEDHRELGEWWEKQHELARWGGRFTRPDGNHYSFTHGGRS
jgi:hypothetical protein